MYRDMLEVAGGDWREAPVDEVAALKKSNEVLRLRCSGLQDRINGLLDEIDRLNRKKS